MNQHFWVNRLKFSESVLQNCLPILPSFPEFNSSNHHFVYFGCEGEPGHEWTRREDYMEWIHGGRELSVLI